MKYFDTIAAVHSLLMWKKTIMELRGPHPTEDSEVLLHKMVDDIIEVNNHMKILKKEMTEMIHHRNLNEIYNNDDDDEEDY